MMSACENDRLKEIKRVSGSIRFALFKILCCLSHGVRDVREAKDVTLVSGSKAVER